MAWLRMPFGKVRDQKLAEDPMGSRIYGGGNFWLKGFLVVVNKDQADKQKASQMISKPDDQKVASKSMGSQHKESSKHETIPNKITF